MTVMRNQHTDNWKEFEDAAGDATGKNWKNCIKIGGGHAYGRNWESGPRIGHRDDAHHPVDQTQLRQGCTPTMTETALQIEPKGHPRVRSSGHSVQHGDVRYGILVYRKVMFMIPQRDAIHIHFEWNIQHTESCL